MKTQIFLFLLFCGGCGNTNGFSVPSVTKGGSSFLKAANDSSGFERSKRNKFSDSRRQGNLSTNRDVGRKKRGRGRQHKQNFNERRQWLEQATTNLLSTTPGTLTKGKWHELASMLTAWSSFAKDYSQAPALMEAILKRLHDERRAGNDEARANISLYNKLLDAWACAAFFRTVTPREKASQRAREILFSLQETYEQEKDVSVMPNAESFRVVLHVVARTEGATIARRLLAWMEYLHKSGKNMLAKPSRSDYILVLDTYANSGDENAGQLAQAFLRHMNVTGVETDTQCYNIAIKAWTKAKRGRESAENADQILSEMHAKKDIITYSSAISAWASSGMRVHAVDRAEELLQQVKDDPGVEPNSFIYNAVMSAWVKSRNPAAPKRTAQILQEMENSDYVQPDLVSYNTHMHALSLQGKKVNMAQRADDLLRIMEKRYDAGEISFGPNLFSYNLVIEAWSKSQVSDAGKRGVEVLSRLAKRNAVAPDTFSFNQVLASLARSSIKGAAKLAEELLDYMEKSYASGLHPKARPDVISYSSVIAAYSRSGARGSAERAENLFNRMKERYAAGERQMKPNRICYNSLITAWAKSGEGTLGARKAEALLEEMQIRYEEGDDGVAPNIVTFNAVLNAWARSGTRCCGTKAESYLDKMWNLYERGAGEVKPNDTSYNTVINAISKSKNRFKAQKALRILRRMDKLYQAGNKEARPNEVTYTAVLNSCAFPANKDEKTRKRALDTAIFTLEELQASRYGHPNQITYGTFIQACANLIHDDDNLRRDVIERVFQQCCKDGQVGEMVLSHLRAAAPADLYKELLSEAILIRSKKSSDGGRKYSRISVDDLPQEWRCNVSYRNRRSGAPLRSFRRNERQGPRP